MSTAFWRERPVHGDDDAARRLTTRRTLRGGSDPRVAVCQVEGYRQPRENPDRGALRITITSVIGNV